MAVSILRGIVSLLMLIGTLSYADEPVFVVGSGDEIAIIVYNEPDLTVRTTVSKNGIVKVPLIGDVLVLNKTPQQIENELESALLDGYLVSPNVTVTIESFRPFFIRGAVQRSGSYDFEFDLTVDKAIAIAGGLKDRASRREWYIIRGTDKQRIKVTPEMRVLPGDIIEIEESLF